MTDTPEQFGKEREGQKGQPTISSVLGVGSRLISGPAVELVETAFARELTDQHALFRGMSLADIAHTVTLTQSGIIPREEGASLLAALLALHEQPPDFVPVPQNGDLYTNREAWLAARTPSVGWLGAGRARRESTTTGFRLTLRSLILAFADALMQAGGALIERAEEFRDALMADYTYLQPAQPTTFGHYLSGFIYPLLRDLERLQALYSRTNQSPAGCGSVNGSRIPQQRACQSALLGFSEAIPHARDAMWQPDGPIEVLSIIVMALVNLDRLAEDLQIFATSEFNLIELADGHSRASVIMPQKKNPYALTYVRGAVNALSGLLTSTVAASRTPSGQIDNRVFAYGDVPRALDTATGVATLMGAVVSAMRFNAPLAASRLIGSFAAATDLAETITLETGLDFRSAHRVVGRLVRDAGQTGKTLRDLTLSDLNTSAQAMLGHALSLSSEAFTRACDPSSAIAARQDIGGAASTSIAAMLASCRDALENYTQWSQHERERIAAAEEKLLLTARKLARGES